MIYAAWLVWIVPIVAVPFVPVFDAVGSKARNWFAVATSALTALIGLYLALSFSTSSSEASAIWVPVLNVPVQILVDGTSVMLAVLISFLSFLIVLYSVGYMKGENGQARYFSLVLLFVGAMLGLVMAGNLIQLYFFWEIVGICSAFLIAFWFDKPEARKAGLKAFVVTRFGDIALFLAVLIILSTLNTTSFSAIFPQIGSKSFGSSTVLLVGVLLLIGAMGKSAQVPFHVWLPDAMEGPTPVSALIHAATMVNAGVYLLIRMYPLFSDSATLLSLVTLVGIVSMVFGAACAVVSEDLKRILAYSTISQLGIMFAAIGVGTILGATYHLISQGLFKALAFLAAGSVVTVTGTRNIEELGGLRKTMKYTYFGFLFAILAMSGIPPLIGFWSKDMIVGFALTTNGAAAAIIVVSTILTALYGFRALYKVFHGNLKLSKTPKESPAVMTVPIVALVISVLVGWLVIDFQQLLPISKSLSIDPLGVGTSLVAAVCGIVIAYIAFSARIQETLNYIDRYIQLKTLRRYLLEGLCFDRFYGFLYARIVLPLARISRYLETGWLGVNVGFLLASMLAVIFLVALGVI
ncbi:MAG: NADH-quinone oxidoreductase subunit L [Thaumarchaeota archaeon]|nr:NADH-quinone oxidoreductase subunit L [Nitrososphaerota archaeon]